MPFVLDARAIIAYLRNENGADFVEDLLKYEVCMVHVVNLCEFYYDCFLLGENDDIACEFVEELESVGLILRDDIDREFWKTMASYIARIRQSSLRVSLADCFAISLSDREKAILVTSDHHEFEPIVEKGFLPSGVSFFR